MRVYGDDLDRLQLSTQLLLLVSLINDAQKSDEKEFTTHNIVEIYIKQVNVCAFSQMFIWVLLLLGDASNNLFEILFSAMSQQGSNDLLILHIHKPIPWICLRLEMNFSQ